MLSVKDKFYLLALEGIDADIKRAYTAMHKELGGEVDLELLMRIQQQRQFNRIVSMMATLQDGCYRANQSSRADKASEPVEAAS